MNNIARQQNPRSRRSGAKQALTWPRQVAVAALAAAMLAGCSASTGATAVHTASGSPATSTTTAAAQPAVTHGVEAKIGDVPWSQVGPGWMLAMWSPAVPTRPGEPPPPDAPTEDTVATTVYLVDPAGNRYAITTFPPPGDRSSPELIGWSGDGSHALFEVGYRTGTFIEVDLHTGTQTTLNLDGNPRFSADGKAILLSKSSNGNVAGTLKRVDLGGNPQLTYPTDKLGGAGQFTGSYLQSPDGTQLVLGTAVPGDGPASRTDTGLVVVGNDGVVARRLPPPIPGADCSPVRWWTSTVILEQCDAHSTGSQLWEVPVDGGAPAALTAGNSGQEDDPGFGEDLGDRDAWQLPSGTFLQSEGACGTMFLSRLTPDMHTTKVIVPGVQDSIVVVVGATADKMVLLGKVGCGGTNSLLTYDPATNTSTVLLGPPINGGGVTHALLYRARTN